MWNLLQKCSTDAGVTLILLGNDDNRCQATRGSKQWRRDTIWAFWTLNCWFSASILFLNKRNFLICDAEDSYNLIDKWAEMTPYFSFQPLCCFSCFTLEKWLISAAPVFKRCLISSWGALFAFLRIAGLWKSYTRVLFVSPGETEITISAGSAGNGRKSCRSGRLWDWGEKKKQRKREWGGGGSLQASAASKRQLEIESTVGTCARSSVSKDSLLINAAHEDRWQQSPRLAFWSVLGSAPHLLFYNSKCEPSKLQSFIHCSDCERRRWFQVLTVASQNDI